MLFLAFIFSLSFASYASSGGEEEKPLSLKMVLPTFLRRALLSTAVLGAAGTAAVSYAGSHDDEPNPEVRRFSEGATTSSSTTSERICLPLSLFLSCVSLFTAPSFFAHSLSEHSLCDLLEAREAKRSLIGDQQLAKKEVSSFGRASSTMKTKKPMPST